MNKKLFWILNVLLHGERCVHVQSYTYRYLALACLRQPMLCLHRPSQYINHFKLFNFLFPTFPSSSFSAGWHNFREDQARPQHIEISIWLFEFVFWKNSLYQCNFYIKTTGPILCYQVKAPRLDVYTLIISNLVGNEKNVPAFVLKSQGKFVKNVIQDIIYGLCFNIYSMRKV